MGKQQTGKRHLPLAGSYNIRDVGGYPTADGRITRWRTFLRADSLHELTPDGRQALIDFGIRTVIDLRGSRERANAPNVFADSGTVNYITISLLSAASPDEESRVTNDLEELYKYLIDDRQENIKAVFDVMTMEAFPVLVHCTAGKDRTGIITALILGLAGVNRGTIAEDYALSAFYSGELFDKLRADVVARGKDPASLEPWLLSEPEAMLNTLAYLEAEYVDVPAYLRHIGLTGNQLDQLRQTIIETS